MVPHGIAFHSTNIIDNACMDDTNASLFTYLDIYRYVQFTGLFSKVEPMLDFRLIPILQDTAFKFA